MKKKVISRLYPSRQGKRFCNYPDEKPKKFIMRSLNTMIRSILTGKRTPPKQQDHWMSSQWRCRAGENALCVTWIGHSSFLIQINGTTILTDPIFGNINLCYRRILPPGISLSELPPIDYILISHNHLDHMDARSLVALRNQGLRNQQPVVLVPEGDKKWFTNHGFVRVVEQTWWQEATFPIKNGESSSLKFTFLPAIHWSQRALADQNRSLWGSWMIEYDGYCLYFAGDTAYSEHFASIAQEFRAIDVAFLPIGPCNPRNWLFDSHIDAADAGRAFCDLKAKHFIPMHWGTFGFGVDAFDTPLEQLRKWWNDHQKDLKEASLHVARLGDPVVFGSK